MTFNIPATKGWGFLLICAIKIELFKQKVNKKVDVSK